MAPASSIITGTEFASVEELEQAFVREMLAQAGEQITIRLESTARDLVGILGAMQLALRHPGLADSPAGANLATWARAIEQRLASVGPATARICSAGWSSELDGG